MGLIIERSGPVVTLTLNRPEVHNALDAETVAELRDAFAALAADPAARVVVLAGAGRSFCAGGDLGWIQATAAWDEQEHAKDIANLDALFAAAHTFPKPLVARIHGAAIGGGAGLVACCDLALSTATARFGFTEVKIGLIPAILARYVLPKIGMSHARALFVSGERFTAERAYEIGLVHGVTTEAEIGILVDGVVEKLLGAAPEAVAATKRMLDALWALEPDAATRTLHEALLAARTGDEAKEGLRAFQEKRLPSWAIAPE